MIFLQNRHLCVLINTLNTKLSTVYKCCDKNMCSSNGSCKIRCPEKSTCIESSCCREKTTGNSNGAIVENIDVMTKL